MADEVKDEKSQESETLSPTPEAEEKEIGKDGKEFDAARAQSTIEKLRLQLKDYEKRAKKADELEAAEAQRKEAELSEIEKLNKRLAEAEARAKNMELLELKRKAGAKFNLPEALISRLQGETLEDLEADAEALSKEIPAKPKPGVSATQIGADAEPKETPEQRRNRIANGGHIVDMFDPKQAAEYGGGIQWPWQPTSQPKKD